MRPFSESIRLIAYAVSFVEDIDAADKAFVGQIQIILVSSEPSVEPGMSQCSFPVETRHLIITRGPEANGVESSLSDATPSILASGNRPYLGG